MEPIRSERLTAALERAVATGDVAEFFDQLDRGSGLPGPRPNLDLARIVGSAIARYEGRADPLLRVLIATEKEYPRIVAAMAFAARSLTPVGKHRPPPWVETAIADLQLIAEDPRAGVRVGIVAALRLRLTTLGEPAVVDLAAWTDGYLQAHVALEALADRELLATLPAAEPVLARLDEAFQLADLSSRSAERTQGMRTLRQCMPAQIAIFAARYPETLAWLESKLVSKRPETREVVQGAITALRRSILSDHEAEALTARLIASGKPPRDPSRIVAGTRHRGRNRG